MIEIQTVNALKDNYCYLVRRSGDERCLVIDPSEPGPVERALEEKGLRLGLILNTHHHHDHVGGNLRLREEFKAPVYCSDVDRERVPGAARGLREGEVFDFAGIEIRVLKIPGHTLGQIAFYMPEAKALFVGDTMFSMGCGRLFEGTPAQMFESFTKIASLPSDTRLFFGHEYTVKNSEFAEKFEPENAKIGERRREALKDIERLGYSPAPTIAREKEVNPFLRASEGAIAKNLGLEGHSPLEVFTELRKRRDAW